MLDLIELQLRQRNTSIHRIDGQTTLAARWDALRSFRDSTARTVMLASISSCGEGYETWIALRTKT